MKDFPKWLKTQLDNRGWSQEEFASKAGMDSGTVSNVIKEIRKPGPDFCSKTASAFKIKESVVFYQAGLMKDDPDDPTQKLSPTELDILSILENKSEAQKRAALSTLTALFESLEGHGHPDENRAATARKK